ncbi:uncharacterized protein LOC119446040 isoform X2 [Dermacentor silvarum]|uniref:uncharacterized protein LOC119446040 isoform X2 n=1 Tax=Dermacentor silvarum TaxID=543639 RepID=UPI002100DA0C|nr:uncharacterized protein LOC119446040 isoform X2 [Dermacentor silvarum]
MKRTTGALFAFAVAVAAYQDCSKYRITITALDNSTCIPNYYRGKFDGLDLIPIPGQKCTSTVEVMRNCNCENRGLMPAARYCIYNITRTEDDNTASITLGLCAYGKCRVDDFSTNFEVDLRNLQLAHILKEFPRPPCIAVNMSVTPQLTAVAGCEFFCYKRQNKDINDGRPCVLEWYEKRLTGEPVVTLTGSCWDGICRPAEPSSSRLVDACHDYERYKSNSKVVKECTYKCLENHTNQVNRPYGLTCLFQKTNLLSRDVVGVCNAGACSQVRQVDGCDVIYYPRRRQSPIGVVKQCVCSTRAVTTTLVDGILCAFRRAVSWTGMKLLEVGVCTKGQCVARPPDRPVPYQFQKKECKIGNVQVSAELIVGASCTATCRRFETEHRRNGTLCLLQYTREEKLVGPAKKTYTIGECFSGKCLRTKNSWDIKL